MNASEKLKALREQKGMSQADCAKAMNIDRTTYAKYENGGSIRRNVEKLATFFNVSVDYLLGRTNEPSGTTNITGKTNKEKSHHSHEERWIESDLEDMLQSAAIHKEDNDAIMFATLLKSVLMQAEKLNFKTYMVRKTEIETKQDTNSTMNESMTNVFT